MESDHLQVKLAHKICEWFDLKRQSSIRYSEKKKIGLRLDNLNSGRLTEPNGFA